MTNQIKRIIFHPLFSGSMIMIVGGNATNFLNYIYHLIMGRLLGPVSYGELAALISLMGLIGMIPLSLGLVVTKFISSAKSDRERRNLANWFSKNTFLLSLVVFSLTALSSSVLAWYLNLENKILVIGIGALFLFLLPSTFNRATLLGFLKFKEYIFSVIVENGGKLVIGIILVFWGYKVFGAVFGLIVSAFIGWLLSRYYIRDALVGRLEKKLNFKPVLLYAFPIVIQSLTITSLYSMDVILVKHFFSAHDGGIYASLSTLGRIIFFGASPIANVMFPIVAKRYTMGQPYAIILLLSLLLTSAIAAGLLIIYGLWPKIAITLLYGSLYLEAAPLLLYFGVFIALLTVANLLVNFYLSIGKVKMVVFPFLAALGQIIAIYIFHQNLTEVISVSVAIASLLVLTLFVYFGYESHRPQKSQSANKINLSGGAGIQKRKIHS